MHVVIKCINDFNKLFILDDCHYFEREEGLYLFYYKQKKVFLFESDENAECFKIYTFLRDKDNIKFYKADNVFMGEVVCLLESLSKSDHLMTKLSKDNNSTFNRAYLILTNACNLSCRYCYADKNIETMNFNVAKNVIDKLVEDNVDSKRIIQLRFFGGEPLLNYETLQKILKYCKVQEEKGVKFRKYLSTNGLLISPKILDSLLKHEVQIKVSVDGSKDIFNYYRISKQYDDVYSVLLDRIKLLLNNYPEDFVTAGITNNYKQTNFFSNLENAYSLGFTSFYMQFVNNESFYEGNLINVLHRECERIKKEYEDILLFINRKAKNKEMLYVNIFNSFVKFLFSPVNSKCECLAGTQSFACDNKGDLFFCQRFNGKEKYRIGSIHSGVDTNKVKEIREINNMERCTKCWVQTYCKGGCFYNNHANQDILNDYLDTTCNIKETIVEELIINCFKIADTDISFINSIYNRNEFVE